MTGSTSQSHLSADRDQMKQHKIAVGVASVCVLGVVLYVVLNETSDNTDSGASGGSSAQVGPGGVVYVVDNKGKQGAEGPSVKTKAITGLMFSIVLGAYVAIALSRIGVVQLSAVRKLTNQVVGRMVLAALTLAVAIYSQSVGSRVIAALAWFLFGVGAIFALVPFLTRYASRVKSHVGDPYTESFKWQRMVDRAQRAVGGASNQNNTGHKDAGDPIGIEMSQLRP